MEQGIRRIFQLRALAVQSFVHRRFQLAEAIFAAQGFRVHKRRILRQGIQVRKPGVRRQGGIPGAAEAARRIPYTVRRRTEDDDLSKFLDYKDSHGDPHHQEFGLVVLHVFNHQTHHRGMVSIYLEEMGVQNDYSNIMDMI
jgi:hypothetical protein